MAIQNRTAKLEQARQILEKYSKQLEEAQSLAKIGSWEWGFDTDKVIFSDELYRIMDWEKDTQKAKIEDIFQAVHVDDLDLFKRAYTQAIRKKEITPIEFRIITPTGEEKWLYAKGGFLLKNESKKPIKEIGIIQDVTELKKTERALAKALEKEKELSELKSRFVSMASHEFRTPLATILTSAALIDRYQDVSQEEKRNKHINRIKSNVNNMRNILDDFLSLSKLEEGKIEVQRKKINLLSFYGELIEELQIQAKSGQSLIHTHKGLVKEVELDPQLLQNISLNLLSNAIKYSGEGTQIQINSIIDEYAVKIEVIDQGIGIPEAEQQHMFTRFFRAKNATNIQGTGLGLTIVQRYVELMQGSISFVSKSDEGTTFTVRLPRT